MTNWEKILEKHHGRTELICHFADDCDCCPIKYPCYQNESSTKSIEEWLDKECADDRQSRGIDEELPFN